MKKMFVLMVLVTLIAGCVNDPAIDVTDDSGGCSIDGAETCGEPEINLRDECIKLCREYAGNLSSGPCLSDNNEYWRSKVPVPSWVCDVAHEPRQDVDNLPENQCQEFRDGLADHFIEVDENCEFIKEH